MSNTYTFPAVQPDIYIGDTLDSLELTPYVCCKFLNTRLAPSMSTAHLESEYGHIARSGSGWNDEPARNFKNKFVQLRIGASVLFTGIVAQQPTKPDGTFQDFGGVNIPSGKMEYTAYSLDYLLDKVYIDRSYIATPEAPEIVPHVNRLFAFNGDGGKLLKNKALTQELFQYYDPRDHWTGLDIVNYLITYFFKKTGFNWTVTGDYSYLSLITPQIDPQGKSVRRILNEIITPARGFTWKVLVVENVPQINVVSISDTDIVAGGTIYIPANQNTIQIQEDIETSREYTDVVITQVDDSAYHKIRISSEPIRVMGSFKLGAAAGGLSKDWNESLAATYNNVKDDEIGNEKYEKLYSAFRFNENWDRSDHDGNGAIPQLNEETGALSFMAENPTSLGYTFDRELPLKKGAKENEYRKPFVLLKTGIDENNKDIYDLIDKLTATPKVGMELADDGPGILLKPTYPHRLADTFYTGKSTFSVKHKYTDCIATLSFYSDTVAACIVDGMPLQDGEFERVKQISVSGYHMWYCLPSTYLDRPIPGDLTTDYTESITKLRDDWEKLQNLANIAKAFYGRIRNTISYTITHMTIQDLLGHVITEVYSGGAFQPAGTVISAVDYDFSSQNQTVTVSSDFLNIDFSKISRNAVKLTEKSIARQINTLDERTKQIPLRPISADGGIFHHPGAFYIAQKDDTKIQIWDKEESAVYSAETEGEGATRAGYFIHGLEYSKLEVEKAELTITKSGAIVARLEYNIETKLYTMSLLIMEVFHPGDNTTFNKKIGYVVFESGKIKKLKQTWFSGDIPVTGRG